jgi:DNA ligase 1
MADIADGDSVEVQGSGSKPYVLRNVGGVFSCTCPAWRNQGAAIEKRTCKHLKKVRGEAAELARVGAPAPKAGAAVGGAGAAKAKKDGPPILLAESWDSQADLRGWWMSEKLDGVRAYWDGKGLVSRLGNVFHAPDWFVADLPKDTPLDGELWIGRREFQRTVGVVRRQDKSEHWREVSYLLFDAPALEQPFEERVARVEKIAKGMKHVRALEHSACDGIDHLRARLAEVEAVGGEGLMLRKPGSRYEIGRSSTLLKVKSFRDAEARVVDYVAGKGRHKGTVGSLVAELPDGTRFSVGTGLSDAERKNPPPKGAVITFRYQELSNAGVPRFPSYVGVRDDVEWPPG